MKLAAWILAVHSVAALDFGERSLGGPGATPIIDTRRVDITCVHPARATISRTFDPSLQPIKTCGEQRLTNNDVFSAMLDAYLKMYGADGKTLVAGFTGPWIDLDDKKNELRCHAREEEIHGLKRTFCACSRAQRTTTKPATTRSATRSRPRTTVECA